MLDEEESIFKSSFAWNSTLNIADHAVNMTFVLQELPLCDLSDFAM